MLPHEFWEMYHDELSNILLAILLPIHPRTQSRRGLGRVKEVLLWRTKADATQLLCPAAFPQIPHRAGAWRVRRFLGRMYGLILFVFALVPTLLNSMQVALAAEQL